MPGYTFGLQIDLKATQGQNSANQAQKPSNQLAHRKKFKAIVAQYIFCYL